MHSPTLLSVYCGPLFTRPYLCGFSWHRMERLVVQANKGLMNSCYKLCVVFAVPGRTLALVLNLT